LVLGVTVEKDWKNGMWAFGIHIKDISTYHEKLHDILIFWRLKSKILI